ncbi:hypothetical protein ANCCEY_05741 [Ancylostoma ceylanicum]|uniref:tyrosine--tRNA ligase n=1 Tax=Ancylostoma ceylanicum TaxID=53326 RepID=A0A0D6LSX2_9BILA|nr:hypothetical protein ANCCEY_05741 [Ancylostoma ceylanicum]
MGDDSLPSQFTAEVEARKKLILRNLQEVLGADKLEKQLATPGKLVHVYWGTATTGRPHVGYFVPMRKIADFLKAGLKIFSKDELTFFPLHSTCDFREYTFDLLRLCGQVSQRDALRAGAEVVKQVDGQFGGVDQRKIFILAEEQLPKLKLGKRWHLMNPMVPGLTGSKMSSSEADSKIDLLDNSELVERKIRGAVCPRQEEDNGVLAFFNFVLFPIVSPGSLLVANREFSTYEEVKDSFLNGGLSEEDLKTALVEFLNELLTKVQDHCKSDIVRDALEKGYQEVVDSKIDSKLRPVMQMADKDVELIKNIIGQDQVVLEDDYALRSCISEGKRIRVTFAIHPKGRFHLGFIMGLLKMKSIINSGVDIDGVVLISDMEAFLDNEKVYINHHMLCSC